MCVAPTDIPGTGRFAEATTALAAVAAKANLEQANTSEGMYLPAE